MKHILFTALMVMTSTSAFAADNVDMSVLYKTMAKSGFQEDGAAGTMWIRIADLDCSLNKASGKAACTATDTLTGQTVKLADAKKFIQVLESYVKNNDSAAGTSKWMIQSMNCSNYIEEATGARAGYDCEVSFKL